LTGRGRLILWSGISVLIVFVGYVFISIPLTHIRTLKAAGMELKASKRTFEGKKREIEILKNLERQYQDLQRRLMLTGKVKKYSDEEILNLLEELKSLAIETDNRLVGRKTLSLKLLSINLPSGVAQSLQKFPVELTIRGRYSTLQDFFSRLNTFERLLTVEEVKIELKSPPELEMTLLLAFYMFAQEEGK
jgi:Tfp pilus assembly protein PilO